MYFHELHGIALTVFWVEISELDSYRCHYNIVHLGMIYVLISSSFQVANIFGFVMVKSLVKVFLPLYLFIYVLISKIYLSFFFPLDFHSSKTHSTLYMPQKQTKNVFPSKVGVGENPFLDLWFLDFTYLISYIQNICIYVLLDIRFDFINLDLFSFKWLALHI